MITVRFPTGFSIQYNTGTYIYRLSEYTDIYTKEDGVHLAQVPNSALIERSTSPCRLYNAVAIDSEAVNAELSLLQKEVRSLKRKIGKVIA